MELLEDLLAIVIILVIALSIYLSRSGKTIKDLIKEIRGGFKE